MSSEYAEEVLATIASRVRAYRKERGLTQLELASRAGLAEGTVSRFEKSHEPPTLSSLLRIATALDVSIEDLVATTQTPTSRPMLTPHEREQRQLVDLVATLDRQAVRQLLGMARLLSDRAPTIINRHEPTTPDDAALDSAEPLEPASLQAAGSDSQAS